MSNTPNPYDEGVQPGYPVKKEEKNNAKIANLFYLFFFIAIS